MKFIRIFLWVLVFSMTLQGYLHADEYGTTTSLIGGISLSMSIWKESLLSSVQALWTTPAHVPLPRAFVIAAIRETVRHPGLHTLPSLRRGLAEHRGRWEAFRDMEVRWMLRHTDLIGAVSTEGRDVWDFWEHERAKAATVVEENRKPYCRVLPSKRCAERGRLIAEAESRIENATRAAAAWARVLQMDAGVELLSWWADIGAVGAIEDDVIAFHRRLQSLHDVSWPADPRLRELGEERRRIANAAEGIWIQRLVESLLERDTWFACLEHLRLKESRIHELMVAAGVQDMINAHERTLNASLRVAENAQMVHDWFAEAYGYAWWLGDDIPAIVRRCSKQSVGDCTRIGPTEIISLSAQYDERVRIIEDWTRRVFLGLWNALPALGLLFILELIVLIIPQRRIYTYIDDDRRLQLMNHPNTMVHDTA